MMMVMDITHGLLLLLLLLLLLNPQHAPLQ